MTVVMFVALGCMVAAVLVGLSAMVMCDRRHVTDDRWGRWDAVGYMSAAAGVLSLFVLVASASVA